MTPETMTQLDPRLVGLANAVFAKTHGHLFSFFSFLHPINLVVV
jgi:hypothetical protein